MLISSILPKTKEIHTKLNNLLKKPMAARTLLQVCLLLAVPAIAQAATINTEAIIKAFDPLLDLAQALSYPLTFLMMLGGMLFVIIGQRSRGLQMIRWAVVGFIGIQLTPGMMRILMQVGQAMRQAQQ